MGLDESWKAVVSSPWSGFDKCEWILMVGQNKNAAHVAHDSEFTTPVYHLPPWLADPHPRAPPRDQNLHPTGCWLRARGCSSLNGFPQSDGSYLMAPSVGALASERPTALVPLSGELAVTESQ